MKSLFKDKLKYVFNNSKNISDFNTTRTGRQNVGGNS